MWCALDPKARWRRRVVLRAVPVRGAAQVFAVPVISAAEVLANIAYASKKKVPVRGTAQPMHVSCICADAR